MASAAGPVPEAKASAVAGAVEARRAERPPVRKAEIFQHLGYRVVEDVASNRLFTQTFIQEFPKVDGKKATNPDEMNPEMRRKIQPPECTTLETAEGERLWALSFGDRLTVVVDSEGVQKTSEDDTTSVQVYRVKNYLLGPKKGSGKVVDLLDYLHAYDQRRNQAQTETYLSLGYVDPHFYLEGESDMPTVIMPFAMKREGQKPLIDLDETTNTLLHEESHAARRVVDKGVYETAQVKRVSSIRGEHAGQTLARQIKERGAHAIGLLVSHRLRDYVDVGAYRRSMKRVLGTYGATESPAKI